MVLIGEMEGSEGVKLDELGKGGMKGFVEGVCLRLGNWLNFG